MSGAFRAVIFDFFGTLTEAVTRGPAHDRIAWRLGCTPVAFARALDETFLDRSIGAYGDPATALGYVASLAGGNPSRTALEAVLPDRVEAIRADTRLRMESVPVLATLHQFGFATAIISDCGPELPIMMPSMPIAPYVDAVAFSIKLGCRKPSPMIYRAACQELGVDPQDCLYVGDGGSRELSGAASVGMAAVRLVAPDLAGHLAFDVDDAWSGDRIDSLTDVFDALYTRRPAGVPA